MPIRHTTCYDAGLRHYDWNNAKNEKLKAERAISFEDVVFHVESGDLLDIIDHPDQTHYPGQAVIIVKIWDYAYMVPYVDDGDTRFLKTIIPSRKATRKYLRRET